VAVFIPEVVMKKLALILALILAAPCFAQEVRQQVEIITLNEADAATCKTGGCKLITEEAIRVVREQIKRSLLLEEVAQRQAEELKKKPARVYCI
jgi:hypothetical protein